MTKYYNNMPNKLFFSLEGNVTPGYSISSRRQIASVSFDGLSADSWVLLPFRVLHQSMAFSSSSICCLFVIHLLPVLLFLALLVCSDSSRVRGLHKQQQNITSMWCCREGNGGRLSNKLFFSPAGSHPFDPTSWMDKVDFVSVMRAKRTSHIQDITLPSR
jgi:hypothetical protein